ncbi:MAG TPA: sulfatase-like hydrolase/transferase [Brumimicrobium sp.]|nr:sulfatase-like hydrolase/transferase [Brumimicrobium sp.]
MSKLASTYYISLLLSLVITWTVGLIIVSSKHHLEGVLVTWLYGLLNTILAVGVFSLIITPIYFLGKKYKLTPIIIHLVFCLILTVEIISLLYFTMTLELLGDTIFQFSHEQAKIIYNNYFTIEWYHFLLPLPIIIYLLSIRLLPNKSSNLFLYSLLFIGVGAVLLGLQINRENGSFTELPRNKTIHFLNSVYNSNRSKLNSLKPEDIEFYQNTINPQLKNSKYPLYHSINKDNTLGPYFNLKNTPPNIVFLVVESLSSSFSGPNADEISYTPFLDSLALKSLYFDNSLATSERSFAVLPSMLGSLPHGKNGYTNNTVGYPNNESLATWLFNNGYIGDFHFGGYARFDYMDLFMNNQGFKNIYDRKEYNYEGTGLKTSIDSIPFGVPDKLFLRNVIEKNNQRKTNVPYIDVYLTLSMHYPYIIDNHEKYYAKVKKTIEQANVNESIKRKHKKYVAEFATFLYTDDALRWYFNERKKSKEHQNTIYIILGDHMMGEVAQSSPIEKYRSALMIYSPLLNSVKIIKGTNSHLDIAPSLHNLLYEKYNFPALESVSWLGQPFDTSSTFQNNRNVLFMLNNREVKDMLHNEYYLSNGKLYTIGDRLKLTPSKNENQKKVLENLLLVSQLLHDEVVAQNLLIPSQSNLEQVAIINKEVNIDKHSEYIGLYDTVLNQPYEEFLFELTLKLSGNWNENKEDDPRLVYVVKRNDENVTWGFVDLNLSERNIYKTQEYKFLIKNNLEFKLLPKDEVAVYFWNKSLSEKSYKAIVLPLSVKARPK